MIEIPLDSACLRRDPHCLKNCHWIYFCMPISSFRSTEYFSYDSVVSNAESLFHLFHDLLLATCFRDMKRANSCNQGVVSQNCQNSCLRRVTSCDRNSEPACCSSCCLNPETASKSTLFSGKSILQHPSGRSPSAMICPRSIRSGLPANAEKDE